MELEEAFQKIDACITSEEKPSGELRVLARQPWFGACPFSLLSKQQKTAQSPVHHPEGSVWAHTLLVVDESAQRKQYSRDPRVFMWAALLHDIGKPSVTKVRHGKITAYDHDRAGAGLAREFLAALTGDTELIERVSWLVRYHMQLLYVVKSLPFQDIGGMKRHTSIFDVALLGYCDRLGRLGAVPSAERELVRTFLRKCGEDPDSFPAPL